MLYVDIHDLQMRVRDVFIDGGWNFNLLYTTIATYVMDRLKLLLVSLNSQVEDCFTWKGNLNGFYTAQDGYYWLNRNEFISNTNEVSWNWLWHSGAGKDQILSLDSPPKCAPYLINALSLLDATVYLLP
ncbi:hypothetical protein QL285_002263 [Trifolium repens]|nr:hypothetical protein QL285_002263 [Trifolium repens]